WSLKPPATRPRCSCVQCGKVFRANSTSSCDGFQSSGMRSPVLAFFARDISFWLIDGSNDGSLTVPCPVFGTVSEEFRYCLAGIPVLFEGNSGTVPFSV